MPTNRLIAHEDDDENDALFEDGEEYLDDLNPHDDIFVPYSTPMMAVEDHVPRNQPAEQTNPSDKLATAQRPSATSLPLSPLLQTPEMPTPAAMSDSNASSASNVLMELDQSNLSKVLASAVMRRSPSTLSAATGVSYEPSIAAPEVEPLPSQGINSSPPKVLITKSSEDHLIPAPPRLTSIWFNDQDNIARFRVNSGSFKEDETPPASVPRFSIFNPNRKSAVKTRSPPPKEAPVLETRPPIPPPRLSTSRNSLATSPKPEKRQLSPKSRLRSQTLPSNTSPQPLPTHTFSTPVPPPPVSAQPKSVQEEPPRYSSVQANLFPHTPSPPRPSVATAHDASDDPLQTVVLVTGASIGGIGHALCLELARVHGCKVYGTVRRWDSLTDVRGHGFGDKGGSVELLPMDVTDRESVRRAVAAVLRRAGKIDILVNNAGIGLTGAIAETHPDDVRAVFETNVIGLLNVTQEVIPFMVKQGSGKIVNMGSMTAYMSLPWSGVYVGSKAAVRAITSSLRMEMLPFGIQVSHVNAGSVRTNIIRNAFKRAEHFQRTPTKLYANLPVGPPNRSASPIRSPPRPSLSGKPEEKPSILQIPNPFTSGVGSPSFAKAVAKDMMAPQMPMAIMAGAWAWIILVFLAFPENLIEYVLAWRYGLSKCKVVPGGVDGGSATGEAATAGTTTFETSNPTAKGEETFKLPINVSIVEGLATSAANPIATSAG